MNDDIDIEVQDHEEFGWIAVEPDGTMHRFPNEDEACAFQRGWRAALGLDPMTGV